MNSSTIKRIIMTFVGIFLTSISVSIFKASLFGTDPFSCFAIGIWNLSQIKFSISYMITNAVLLLGVFIFDKHYIGLGTLLNLFLAGYVVEKGMQLLDFYLPQRTLTVRILLLIVAVVLMCFASSLYFTADMGVSPYDACALLLQRKLNFHSEHAELELTFSSQHWDSSWEQLSVLEHLLQLLAWVL